MNKLLLFILIAGTLSSNAQTVNDFALINVKDGKSVSLSNFGSVTTIVVVFTSHECPYDNYYKDRLKELVTTYSDRVQFLLVNSNQELQESAEKMAIHYSDLNIPYLADKDQTVMENFGAHKSPEVFLLANKNGKFSILYSGAIDDNPQVAKDVKQSFLKDALNNVLSGQRISVVTQRATGCTIRRK